jgi:hypothetical protein
MKRNFQRGHTLIELAIYMGGATLLAACVLVFLNSHFAMLRTTVPYRFLARHAPLTGLLLTKTMGNADDYRIYSNRTNAQNDTNRTTSGTAIHLWMRQPDGNGFREAVISFETINGQPGLYFFLRDPVSGFPANPSWQLAGGDLNNVNFFNVSANPGGSGILQATLSGKNGTINEGSITYAIEKE